MFKKVNHSFNYYLTLFLNFIATTLIVLFLLVVQFYFRNSELISGNDLNISIVKTYVFSNLPWMLALVIPVSSLITAVSSFKLYTKSLNVDEQDSFTTFLLIPLISAGLLSILMFFFVSYNVPDSNLQARSYNQAIKHYISSKDEDKKFSLPSNSRYRSDREKNIDQLSEEIEKIEQNKKNNYEKRLVYLKKYIDDENQLNSILNKIYEGHDFAPSDLISIAFNVPENKEIKNDFLEYLNKESRISLHFDRSSNKYEVEIYKKSSIAFAVFALFLWGVLLGVSFTNKYYILIPVGIITIFAFWALLITGEKLADRLILDPFASMWFANFVLLFVSVPVAFFAKKKFYSFFAKL